jgi:hypothetical protein
MELVEVSSMTHLSVAVGPLGVSLGDVGGADVVIALAHVVLIQDTRLG